ncbi:hypothetical protein MRB53_014616 [Persea americana]|uniref:Uncharacterized protein n=1 Tax=Persea americana TaxID=3435 RepID=A0ACC2KBZ1_PERAE|nr:hypothetical protein MRB53_014616 [Persea americana]
MEERFVRTWAIRYDIRDGDVGEKKKGHNNSNRNKRKEGQEALEKKRGLWVKPRRGRSTPTYVVKAWFASSSSWFCFVLWFVGWD